MLRRDALSPVRVRLELGDGRCRNANWEHAVAPHGSGRPHTRLGYLDELSIVRQLREPGPIIPPAVNGPRRVVVLQLLAHGTAEYQVTTADAWQLQQINLDGWAATGPPVDVTGEFDIRRALFDRADIVYIIAHGHTGAADDDPVLSDHETLAGSTIKVSPRQLLRRLRDAGTQLVVLRACNTDVHHDAGWSYAEQLHHGGVPIVISFNDFIDAEAGGFMTCLHTELIATARNDQPVDVAVTAARRAHLMGAGTGTLTCHIHPDHTIKQHPMR